MTAPKEPGSGGAYISVNQIYDICMETRDAVRDIQAKQRTFRQIWAWVGSIAGVVSVSLSVAAFVAGQG